MKSNSYVISVKDPSNILRSSLPLTALEQSNRVYRLQCKDRDACYVGQTARELGVRVKEHERCSNKRPTDERSLKKLETDSAIAVHAVLNEHSIEFGRPCMLKNGFRTYKQRLFAESIFIHTTPGVVNRCDGSDLSSFWQAICLPKPGPTSSSSSRN